MTDLQTTILDIYKEFKKICDKYNLQYFATGGTAIGAVRHKGFIPWDDDLDIDMPASDYIKFLDIAKRELPDNLKVFNGLENKADYVFCKIHNTSTMLTTSILINSPQSYTGVFIDIFPLSGMPNNNKKREEFEKQQIKAIRKLYFKKILSEGDYIKEFGSKSPAEQVLVNDYVETLTKYDFWAATYVRRAGSTMMEQSCFQREWYDDHIEMSFEDTTVRLPMGYKYQLSKRFGNYMKMPPIGERVSIHNQGGVVDLRHSYKNYQKIMRGKYGDTAISTKFTNRLSDLAHYEMIRYAKTLSDLDSLKGDVWQKNCKISELIRNNDILREENQYIKSENLELIQNNQELVHQVESLMGLKASGRLFLGNIKRKIKLLIGVKNGDK